MLDATQGGWHDCGDYLTEGITQSYTAYMLALTAAVFSDRDTDNYGANHINTTQTDGIPDVLYEAKHGCDYVINAYNNADGNIGSMILSVGDFGKDHNWWGRPEYQDQMPEDRGGPPRAARNETGANITGDFAAAMALTGKMYEPFDYEYAATCISIAEELYTYAKNNQDATETSGYNGNGTTNDEIAAAAVALAWATEKPVYIDELCYDTEIGSSADLAYPMLSYEGGWFEFNNLQFSHGNANTDWASVNAPVLWSFYSLILKDEALCNKLLSDLGKSDPALQRQSLYYRSSGKRFSQVA